MTKMIQSPWGKIAKISLSLSVLILILGIGMFFALDKNPVLLINAMIWAIIGLFFLIVHSIHSRKRSRLIQEGACYDGIVLRLIPIYQIRIGRYISGFAECSYETTKGQQIVKSGCLLFPPFIQTDTLYAKVYVEKNYPNNYYVELYQHV